MFIVIYLNLKSVWRNNHSWPKFFLKFSALGQLFKEDKVPSSSTFFQVYLSSWWWNKFCIRTCIKDKNQKKNFDFIAHAVSVIHDQGRFNQPNITGLINICFHLEQQNLLTEDNLNLIFAHPSLPDLFNALHCLNQAELLTQDNFTLISRDSRADTWAIARILSDLNQSKILNQMNLKLVTLLEIPHTFIYIFSDLNRAKILTQENFNLLTGYSKLNAKALAKLLSFLTQSRILTQDNFKILVEHERVLCLGQILSDLSRARLLTQNNFLTVTRYQNTRLGILEDALYCLHEANLLNQVNFNTLINPAHHSLLLSRVWDIVPIYLFNQENFERLVFASLEMNPLQAIDRVIYQIINPFNAPLTLQPFNTEQSTHTASVHRTVSESASKLMSNYGIHLNLEETIKEIKVFIKDLNHSKKNDAAKRCIARITAHNYNFVDSSKVSTRQLLALVYVAIHDESKRYGSLEDAKSMFIEGLYEIQRGYNLNDIGIDNDLSTDYFICPAGTFNKIIEKLNGIHADVNVLVVTKTSANAKFPKLAQTHAIQYLISISSPQTIKEYDNAKALLETIKQENTLEPIWNKIEPKISSELWDEFQEVYGRDKSNADFNATINNGIYLDAPADLSKIETQLMASNGYRASVRQLRLKFFDNQSANLNGQSNQPKI